VLGTAGLLLVLATINALIVAALAARDSARNHATLRAVGATPRQTTATLVVSQMGGVPTGGRPGPSARPGPVERHGRR
jgi:putative ABC transport system permease protein